MGFYNRTESVLHLQVGRSGRFGSPPWSGCQSARIGLTCMQLFFKIVIVFSYYPFFCYDKICFCGSICVLVIGSLAKTSVAFLIMIL